LDSTGPYRFGPDSRLNDAQSFGRVFKGARRSRDKCFTVLYRPRQSGKARLGLAISKKHCRLASNRNRIKRVVRESFRLNQRQLEGLDIVVINQPATAGASNAELFASLSRHWLNCRVDKKAPDTSKSDG